MSPTRSLIARAGVLFENRSLRQTVAKNAFWLVAGQVIGRALKFIIVAYAARLLGVDAIGALAFATALTTLSFTFSDVGVSTLLVREFQRTEDTARLLRTLLRLKLAFVALSSGVALITFFIFGSTVPAALLLITLATTIFDVTRDFLTAIARAKEKAQYETVILGVEGLFTVLFGILALNLYGTITTLALAYLGAALVTFIVSTAIFLPAFRGAGKGKDWHAIRTMLKDMWPFAAAAAIAVTFTQADTVMIGWIRGSYDAGLYGAGSRIMQILLVLPALIGATLLPALARFQDDAKRQAFVVRNALSGVLLLSVPVTFGGVVLAPHVLGLVYGSAFAPGGTAFALLLASFLAFAVTTILDYLLLSRNLQAKNFTYTAIAAVLNLVLNAALIPTYGPAGAAAASLCAQILNLTLTMNLARKIVSESLLSWDNVTRIVIAGLVMVAAVTWIELNIIPRILLGAVVYAIMLLALKTPFVYESLKRAARA